MSHGHKVRSRPRCSTIKADSPAQNAGCTALNAYPSIKRCTFRDFDVWWRPARESLVLSYSGPCVPPIGDPPAKACHLKRIPIRGGSLVLPQLFCSVSEYLYVTKLFVGNLPFSATEDAVRALFAAHGTVESLALITDRDTGRPRGFGFVEMANADATRAMQALDGKDFGGRALKVNEAKAREGGGGGGGGRGPGGGGGRGRY